MSWAGKVWRWGVIAPVTVAAVAGVIADVRTATLFYWWLLAPSYLTVAIATWKSLTRQDAERAKLAAQAHAEVMAERGESDLVSEAPHISVGAVTFGAYQLFLRFLATFAIAFMYLIAIQATIAMATWARPYWYVYGPAIAVIAVIAWLLWREGAEPKPKKHAQPIVR
jgi:hypothetical protein